MQHPAMAQWYKILLLPLHFKLGLMKNFKKLGKREYQGTKLQGLD
jgi:hypothetical protein